MTRVPRLAAVLAVPLTAALALTACGTGAEQAPADGSGLKVVTAFYPLEFVVDRIGGDRVSVTSLTSPGAEPHDVELTPAQVAAVSDAALVVYLQGFQPAVDDAVAQEAADALDAGQGITRISATAGQVAEAEQEGQPAPASDPHVWLDPTNLARIADGVRARLEALDPAGADTYRANAARLAADLAALDTDWRTGTATCARRDLVTSHEAFGYLAARYGFRQVGISGLTPDAEPSPAKIAEVADFVRANGVTTLYYETLVDPKVAQTVAAETGAATAVLDPLEGIAEGSTGDYLTVMRQNLETVRKGQSCS